MKIDDYLIGKKNDRRRKLTDCQRGDIKKLYFIDKLGIREISRLYENFCSRRLIQFILFPERDKKLKIKVKEEKRWLKYYDTKKHKEAMRSTRAYKRSLMKLNDNKQK